MYQTYNALLAQKLIEEFSKRNMEAFYCTTKADALAQCLSMLQKGDTVANGGSKTLYDIGLIDALKGGDYRYLNARDAEGPGAREQLAREALLSDCYFMSANAICETGEIVNIDGIGNRTAALLYGPKRVVIVVGLNKVEPTLKAAILRAKTHASRLCLLQFSKEYASFDALCAKAEEAGSHLLITRKSVMPGRVKILLVGEALGL